jgi:hypothetical protein
MDDVDTVGKVRVRIAQHTVYWHHSVWLIQAALLSLLSLFFHKTIPILTDVCRFENSFEFAEIFDKTIKKVGLLYGSRLRRIIGFGFCKSLHLLTTSILIRFLLKIGNILLIETFSGLMAFKLNNKIMLYIIFKKHLFLNRQALRISACCSLHLNVQTVCLTSEKVHFF